MRLVELVRRDTATEGSLQILFRTEGIPTEMNVADFQISFAPDEEGQDGRRECRECDLDVEALVISGDSMGVAGNFAGRLILGGADELVLADDVPSVTVDGNFQATIPRASND